MTHPLLSKAVPEINWVVLLHETQGDDTDWTWGLIGVVLPYPPFVKKFPHCLFCMNRFKQINIVRQGIDIASGMAET